MQKSLTKIKVEKAVGTVLAHDSTRIIPGEFNGVGFRKGYVSKQEDISELQKIGKEHIYVLNLTKDQLHEDEAALRIARAICGDNLTRTKPAEGKMKVFFQPFSNNYMASIHHVLIPICRNNYQIDSQLLSPNCHI